MDATIRHWLESTLHGPVTSTRRAFGGGSRTTWFVELGAPDDPRRVVVRHQGPSGASAGSPFSLAREAVVYRALQPTDVPVAELLAVSPDEDALVLARLPGTARIQASHRGAAPPGDLAPSFFAALGALHRLKPDDLDLPGFTSPAGTAAHALDDLARWRALAVDHGLMSEPLVAVAFAWLAANPPPSVARTVMVQGDTGPGNFLHEDGRVTGLVDWEFAHLGDPMDDIAWIDMRSGTDAGFGDVARRDQLYRQATGRDVDPVAVRYYAVMVELRCSVTTGAVIRRGGGALGLNAYRAPHQRFLSQLGAAVCEASGFTPTLLGPAELPGGGDLLDEGDELARLRAEMTGLREPSDKLVARERLLGAEHEAARKRWGRHLESSDAADLRATLGTDVSDALPTRIEAHDATGDQELLGLLVRRAQRRQVLWDTPAAGGHTPVRPPSRPR